MYNRKPNKYKNIPGCNKIVKRFHIDLKSKDFHDFFHKFCIMVSTRLVKYDEGENLL